MTMIAVLDEHQLDRIRGSQHDDAMMLLFAFAGNISSEGESWRSAAPTSST